MQAARAPTRKPINVPALQASWLAFDTPAHLRPIRSEADYDRTVTLMNALLDVAGDDEDHPLSSLLELAAELVSRYEQAHHAIEAENPQDALRFLMEARGLKQEAPVSQLERTFADIATDWTFATGAPTGLQADRVAEVGIALAAALVTAIVVGMEGVRWG